MLCACGAASSLAQAWERSSVFQGVELAGIRQGLLVHCWALAAPGLISWAVGNCTLILSGSEHKGGFVEDWASIRSANPLVDADSEWVVWLHRELKAALSKKSTSAGSNLFVAANCTGKPASVVRAGAGEDLHTPGKPRGEPYIRRPPCTWWAYLNSIFHGRHSIKDVGIKTAQEVRTLALALAHPLEWTPSSGGRSSRATLQVARGGNRPEGLAGLLELGAASDGLAS